MANNFAKLKSLASTNLFILALRLVQFFFAGMEVGLMGFYIKSEIDVGESASSPFVFVLVIGVVVMMTQFAYCFTFTHPHLYFWDMALATAWIVSFFWLLNFEQPTLNCSWSAFNPFGADHCGQTRAVLIIQIVLGCLWYLTAGIGLFTLFQNSRARKGGEEDV